MYMCKEKKGIIYHMGEEHTQWTHVMLALCCCFSHLCSSSCRLRCLLRCLHCLNATKLTHLHPRHRDTATHLNNLTTAPLSVGCVCACSCCPPLQLPHTGHQRCLLPLEAPYRLLCSLGCGLRALECGFPEVERVLSGSQGAVTGLTLSCKLRVCVLEQ